MRFSEALGLRASSKPQVHQALSGVVLVVGGKGRGYANIRFGEEMVRRVGQDMPQGIGPENPAYLKAMQMGERWKILAIYVTEKSGVVLAEFPTKPDWLKPRYHAV